MNPILRDVLIAAGLFIVGLVVSVTVVAAVLVRLPVDYFMSTKKPRPPDVRHPAIRWTLLILKNLMGILIVAVGIVMTLPGVPGSGVLMILAGVLLVNFPGKYRLERWMIRLGPLRKATDWIRKSRGHEPFQIPE